MKRLHALVSGRVQGVSFRYYTKHKANQLQLTGWVRNLPDGRVETVAEGPDSPLEEFVRFLHVGPQSAIVDEVEITWSPAGGEFYGFKVR